jgi:hypothetical protein
MRQILRQVAAIGRAGPATARSSVPGEIRSSVGIPDQDAFAWPALIDPRQCRAACQPSPIGDRFGQP